jgi:hypothetical protein
MKIDTKFKYAAITPEGEILNMFTNKDMFSKKETAENNLKKWIEEAKFHEKNAKAYGESYPEYVEFCLKTEEQYRKQAEMFEACRVARIKITLEVVG